jgi:hypothetical protein
MESVTKWSILIEDNFQIRSKSRACPSLLAIVTCNVKSVAATVSLDVTPHMPILVAVLLKAWVWGHSLAGIAGSSPTGGTGFCLM